MSRDLLAQVWAQPDRRPQLGVRAWETLLGQARQSTLLGRLAQHHLSKGWMASVPEGPRRYLEGALRLVDRQHHEVRWELACIARALSGIRSPVVILKGAAYFVADLPPRAGRLFSDIDIMVSREALAEAEGALFRAGWISEERDAYNDRYYRKWMHEIPPLRHVQRGTVVDLHHTITPPTSRFRVDGEALLSRIQRVDGGANLFVLSPQDMVLHSAVHLFQEGEFGHGLRDLLDLDDLLRHFGQRPGFWPGLFDRAAEIGLGEPLFHALHHIERLFGAAVPGELQHLQAAVRPPWVARTVLSALLEQALYPDHPSCDARFTRLARWLLYVRSHWLRMPLHLMLPHLGRKAYMRHFPKDEGAALN